ncbi:unnamed protein product, partial [Mesorhabditis spiculigera]
MTTYAESYSRKGRHKLKIKDGQVEAVSTQSGSTTLRLLFCAWFLPQGYPHTVTADYLDLGPEKMKILILGALATEAVLKGAGVGNEAATALAASMTWLVKDGLGMVGRILFASAKGSQLDYDCKKWRLVADVLNDCAFFIDLLSPLWPNWFLLSACCSSLFRCVVGVAGGATRTTIVQHQARRNNLADVAAKDGSQETLVNALALVVSLVLLPAVSGRHLVIWCLFALLTALHLFANYRAMRTLRFNVLNGKRAALVIRNYLETGRILDIDEANEREPLFHGLYPLRHLGCSLLSLLEEKQRRSPEYTIYTEHAKSRILYDKRRGFAWVAMAEGSEAVDQLEAFFALEQLKVQTQPRDFNDFTAKLQKIGWRTDAHHLNFDEWTYNVIS